MTVFWNIWVIVFIFIFLAFMALVVIKYWRTEHTADKDKTIESFDGIDENDAPPPRIFYLAYLIAFIISAGFLVLYPGLGNWAGLMGWKQIDDALSSPTTDLDMQIAPLSDLSLGTLAANPQVTKSGELLFQNHCAACHRANAQGQKHFPNLTDNEWLYGGTEKDIIHSIEHGRHGAMPGWKGILSEDQILKMSYYIGSLQRRNLNAPQVKIDLGKEIFVQYCSSCHGDGTVANIEIGAPVLSDDIWLHGGSIEEIKHTIEFGLNNLMPAFDEQLSRNEVLAIGAYITEQRLDYDAKLAALDADSVARGEYLANAGDCVACHSSESGERFAGGLPFKTPFGTIYSTNITPHFSEGIGDNDYAEFKAALFDGKGKHGYLYPAMPYTSYQYLTEQDTQDLWSYLQSITAVPRQNDANEMMFPSNIRQGLLGWNLVFMDTEPLSYAAPEHVELNDHELKQWQQGKYWVMGLGHCSECHTPRNLAQALIPEKIFQGNIIDGWNAPNISAQELHEDKWDLESLTDFLHTGHSDKGSAFAGMADVVKNSTSLMTRDDIEAISRYLLVGDVHNTIPEGQKQLSPTGFVAESYSADQFETFAMYADTCGACHGEDGKGRDPIAPTLLNNGIIMHSDPFNTIAVTIRGLAPTYLDEERNFMPMTSFQNVLTDSELAKLISFVRLYLGGREEPVTAAQVKAVRQQLEKAGFAGNLHTTPDMYDHKDTDINID
ncbi:c-type cytochrome [Shewanella sp. 10N.286.45.A1]|uniref:c-type cytochrome n=1 Tax=Shewanella sp. 10N.286.45.A1 TaxID=3229694 RepID=UPI00354E681B